MAKKKPVAALFVDLPSFHQSLRSLHHRVVDPALLAEIAGAHGRLERSVVVSDWEEGPKGYAEAFEEAGFQRVQAARTRLAGGGRRREVVRDGVALELFAQVIELLFRDAGPEVDALVIASCDPSLARVASLVRERFQKEVRVIGVEGGYGEEELGAAATSWEALGLPQAEPTDLEGLKKVIAHLEELERRKRYLNFKYIRETVVRKVDLSERGFDAAERLLSDAIACGVLVKLKIDDKYKPGQHFTAYALDRESEYFKTYGSGEPAPVHEDEPEREDREERGEGRRRRGGRDEGEGERGEGRRRRGGRDEEPEGERERPARRAASRDEEPDDERGSDRGGRGEDRGGRGEDRGGRGEDRGGRGEDRGGRDEDDEGRRKRKRRRRRKKPGSEGNSGNGAPAEDELMPAQLAAGTGTSKKGRGRRQKKGGPHNQDRVGRLYEAPSRFLTDPDHKVSNVSDEDIDEDQILKHLKM